MAPDFGGEISPVPLCLMSTSDAGDGGGDFFEPVGATYHGGHHGSSRPSATFSQSSSQRLRPEALAATVTAVDKAAAAFRARTHTASSCTTMHSFHSFSSPLQTAPPSLPQVAELSAVPSPSPTRGLQWSFGTASPSSVHASTPTVLLTPRGSMTPPIATPIRQVSAFNAASLPDLPLTAAFPFMAASPPPVVSVPLTSRSQQRRVVQERADKWVLQQERAEQRLPTNADVGSSSAAHGAPAALPEEKLLNRISQAWVGWRMRLCSSRLRIEELTEECETLRRTLQNVKPDSVSGVDALRRCRSAPKLGLNAHLGSMPGDVSLDFTTASAGLSPASASMAGPSERSPSLAAHSGSQHLALSGGPTHRGGSSQRRARSVPRHTAEESPLTRSASEDRRRQVVHGVSGSRHGMRLCAEISPSFSDTNATSPVCFNTWQSSSSVGPEYLNGSDKRTVPRPASLREMEACVAPPLPCLTATPLTSPVCRSLPAAPVESDSVLEVEPLVPRVVEMQAPLRIALPMPPPAAMNDMGQEASSCSHMPITRGRTQTAPAFPGAGEHHSSSSCKRVPHMQRAMTGIPSSWEADMPSPSASEGREPKVSNGGPVPRKLRRANTDVHGSRKLGVAETMTMDERERARTLSSQASHVSYQIVADRALPPPPLNGFEHSAALGTEAKNAFQAKEYTRAVELFGEAIRHDSENVDFYADRAVCLSVLGRYEDALRDGERCVELRPDWPRGYARRGLSEFCLGAYESAAESYRQGLQLAPYDSELEQGLRKALDMAKQTDEENADGLREPEKASVNGQKKASVKCSDEDGLSEMSDGAQRSRAQTMPQVQTNEGCLLEKQEEMGPTKSLPLKGKVPSRLRAFNREKSVGKSA